MPEYRFSRCWAHSKILLLQLASSSSTLHAFAPLSSYQACHSIHGPSLCIAREQQDESQCGPDAECNLWHPVLLIICMEVLLSEALICLTKTVNLSGLSTSKNPVLPSTRTGHKSSSMWSCNWLSQGYPNLVSDLNIKTASRVHQLARRFLFDRGGGTIALWMVWANICSLS